MVYSLSGVHSVWTKDCSDIACIRNSEDLKANYKCDRLSVAGGHNLFLRYNLGSARSDIQAVYYNISIRDTNITSKLESTFTNECCNPSDKYCKVHLVYSSAIFYNIHPRMLFLLISLRWTRKVDIFNYPQFCWSPHTFCDEDDVENILFDFTSEVCYSCTPEICSEVMCDRLKLVNNCHLYPYNYTYSKSTSIVLLG